MACCAAKGIPCGLRMPVELAVPAFRSLKSPSVLMFAAYALGLLPLADMGISPSLLPRLHIPNFITGELSKTPAGGVLVVLFYLLAFFLSAALLFVLPQMVLGGRVFGCAARSSLRMWKKSWRNALLPAALFCAAWCFLFRWPGAVPVTFIGITGAGLPELAVNLFSCWAHYLHSSFQAHCASCLLYSAFRFSPCSIWTWAAGRRYLWKRCPPFRPA